MKIAAKKDVVKLIHSDAWMMDILETLQTLHLPDCWICAGFVRSKVWDVLHHFEERTPLPDVDIVYFDDTNLDVSEEKRFEKKLLTLRPNVPWSVKNQARMHVRNNVDPYTSTLDAIAKFPETATAIAVRLNDKEGLILSAPHGVRDIFNLDPLHISRFRMSE